jgi:hypothetical protein
MPDLRDALEVELPALRAASASALAVLDDRASLATRRILAEEDEVPLVRRAAERATRPTGWGEAVFSYGAGQLPPGSRLTVMTPDGRVSVEWADSAGAVVLFDVPLGVALVDPGGAGAIEAVPTE